MQHCLSCIELDAVDTKVLLFVDDVYASDSHLFSCEVCVSAVALIMQVCSVAFYFALYFACPIPLSLL